MTCMLCQSGRALSNSIGATVADTHLAHLQKILLVLHPHLLLRTARCSGFHGVEMVGDAGCEVSAASQPRMIGWVSVIH